MTQPKRFAIFRLASGSACRAAHPGICAEGASLEAKAIRMRKHTAGPDHLSYQPTGSVRQAPRGTGPLALAKRLGSSALTVAGSNVGMKSQIA